MTCPIPVLDLQGPGLTAELGRILSNGPGFLCVTGLDEHTRRAGKLATTAIERWFLSATPAEMDRVRKPTPGYGPGLQYEGHMDKEQYQSMAGTYTARGREDYVICHPMYESRKAGGEKVFSGPGGCIWFEDVYNRWPSSRIQAALEEWYFAVESLAVRLLSMCIQWITNYDSEHANALTLQIVQAHTSNIVAGYHQSLKPNERAVVEKHSDTGLLTLLQYGSGAEMRGLQLKPRGGDWMDVTCANWSEGTLLFNIGDSLAHLSGGLFESTPHRVIHTGPVPHRMCLAFFLNPRYDLLLEPLGANQEEMAPVVAGQIHHMYFTSPVDKKIEFDSWCESRHYRLEIPRQMELSKL